MGGICLKKLLILDSNSIINRAFYGIRPLTTKDGLNTNAVYGFINILLKLIGDVKPDYICAAFDLKEPTFRHKMYSEYKAQRKPAPPELIEQFEPSKSILANMNIPVLQSAGYEADDIIGTVSKICEENKVECFIATGDKDDLQLASDKTKVILTVTRSGVNETTVYDANAVKEKYGVTPAEFIDVKALMGDKSDNIPGVAGIGEKGAVTLISKYGSIENVYENLNSGDIKGAMLRKLTEGRDSAFLSKKLATINVNVPIEFDIENCSYNGEYSETLYDILMKLELKSIIKRLELTPSSKTKPKKNVFEGFSYNQILSETECKKLVDEILKQKEIALHFEFSEKIRGIAVAFAKKSFYISFDETAMLDILNPVLENENIKKTVCDIKPILVYLNEKSKLVFDYDIAIAGYIIEPSASEYDVNYLSEKYLGQSIASPNAQMSFFDDNTDYENICKKAISYIFIREETYKILEKNNQLDLFRNIEMPLIKVLADMQIYGMYIDKEQLKRFGESLREKISVIENEIYNEAGETFNINSPQQLGTVLFEKLELPASKKIKSGYSTNAEVLEKLKNDYPIVSKILEYRHLKKLSGTYCDSLIPLINEKTHRIHSVFNQTVTVTGRISSTEPNMQNIPTRTELGREMRKMFTAQNDDYILIDADYSQIELRILAHIANDSTMINAFKSNEDIHTVTASQVFNVPIDKVTKEQRSNAKAVNFGIVYGIGDYGLATDLNIPIKQAKAYISQYLEKYHGVREYMESIKAKAKEDGYVKTLMNRIRYIPELKSTNYNMRSFGERVALNMPIQGTAADIIKLAMIRVHKRLNENKLKSKLILQVHDELIIETYIPEKETVKKILREEMENAVSLSVPLTVDMSEGKSWYDAK